VIISSATGIPRKSDTLPLAGIAERKSSCVMLVFMRRIIQRRNVTGVREEMDADVFVDGLRKENNYGLQK